MSIREHRLSLAGSFPFRAGVLLVALGSLSGCYAGLGGMVAGFVAVSGGGGGGSGRANLPPTVDVGAPQYEDLECSRNLVTLQFAVHDDDGGEMSARVEVLRSVDDAPVKASLSDGDGCWSDTEVVADNVFLVRGLQTGDGGGAEATCCVQVEPDTGDAYNIRFWVTPIDGRSREGTAEVSDSIFVGNSQITVDDVRLFANDDTLTISFSLIDAESDPVPRDDDFMKVELAIVDGDEPGEFQAVPLCLTERHEFFSGPGLSGQRESFIFDTVPDTTDEECRLSPELAELMKHGFAETVRARVSVQSFTCDEVWSVAEVEEPFCFDHNDPPWVEIISAGGVDAAESGIVPIRYRILDDFANPADVLVECRLDDSGFQRAIEFPVSPSENPFERCSLDPRQRDNLEPCAFLEQKSVHVFLWDARVQLGADVRTSVDVRLSASDRERGDDFAEVTVGPLDFSGFEVEAEKSLPVFLSWVTPSALTVGDIDGDGFLDVIAASGDVAYLRGSPAGLQEAVEVELEHSATTALATGDCDGNGLLDVVVAYPASNKIGYLRFGASRLEEAGIFDVELLPIALASDNFDDDGYDDVVVVNRESNSVSYLRGSGAGLEKNPTRFSVPDIPVAVATGDFDGDDYPDVVVASLSHRVSYLRGGPEGLQPPGDPIEVGKGPVALATGDFDGDGYLDVAVANTSSHDVSCVWGSPDGLTRREGEDAKDAEVGEIPRSLVAGDFDGNGVPEVAVAGWLSDTITRLAVKERGAGLQPTQVILVGDSPHQLATGDFDGDGVMDLLVGHEAQENQGVPEVILLRGGTRRFEIGARVEFDFIGGMVTGDFSADGTPRAVVGEGRTVFVLRGLGAGPDRQRDIPDDAAGLVASVDGNEDGELDVVVVRGEGGAGGELVNVDSESPAMAGHFDNDRELDLVLAMEGEIRYYRGVGIRTELWKRIPLEGPTFGGFRASLAAGNFDGDDFLDLVVAHRGGDYVRYLRGGEGGLERAGEDIPVGDQPGRMVTGDFDGDGRLDVVVLNEGTDDVSYLKGGESGLAKVGGDVPVGLGPQQLETGDFDGDGTLDVVVVSGGSDEVTFLGASFGGLERASTVPVGAAPSALVTGDFDDDGLLDLVVANEGSGSVSRVGWRGADGGFRAETTTVGWEPAALAAGDFDGDGHSDVAVANTQTGSVSYLRGGGAALESSGEYAVGSGPSGLVTGDFDGDGFVGLLVRCSATVHYLRGGPEGLERSREVLVAREPGPWATGDFDGDGFLDVLIVEDRRCAWPGREPCRVSFLRGGRSGPALARTVPSETAPKRLVTGDVDGDGRADVVAVGSRPGPQGLSYFRQRYRAPHVSRFFPGTLARARGEGCDLPAGSENPPVDPVLEDPAARYRLDLPAAPFRHDTQVCIVPEPAFALPRKDAREARENGYLTYITDTVALLRASNRIEGTGYLTLRLREDLDADNLDRLRVFHQGSSAAEAVWLRVPIEKAVLAQVDESYPAVRFPIESFGNYAVAIHRVTQDPPSP